jgi:hypothetical protein
VCLIVAPPSPLFRRPQEGKAWLDQLGLDTIIQSRLNPLKVCIPERSLFWCARACLLILSLLVWTHPQLCASTVVTEFLKIAGDLCGLLPSCRAVLERNKRIVLPTKSVYGNANQLDSFFPFDPYLLRHSSKHISSVYQTWSPAPETSVPTAAPSFSSSSASSSSVSPSRSSSASSALSSALVSSAPPSPYSAVPLNSSTSGLLLPPPSPSIHVPLTFLESLPLSQGSELSSYNSGSPGSPGFLGAIRVGVRRQRGGAHGDELHHGIACRWRHALDDAGQREQRRRFLVEVLVGWQVSNHGPNSNNNNNNKIACTNEQCAVSVLFPAYARQGEIVDMGEEAGGGGDVVVLMRLSCLLMKKEKQQINILRSQRL